jgi:methyl-accepting chemotaxis protein/methyl-accepting chemotaxis protein-1 (serine sensor receptor)
MRSWTIGTKLFTCVAGLLGVLALIGVLGIRTAAAIKGHLDVATLQTAAKVDLGHDIQETVIRLRSEQRRALLAAFAKDAKTVAVADARIEELLAAVETKLGRIEALLVSDEGRRTVAAMRSLSKAWAGAHVEIAGRIGNGRVEDAWALAREKANPLIDQIDARGEELLKQQQASLEASRVTADASYGRARLMLLAALGVAAALGVWVVFVVRGSTVSLRDTARQLSEGAEQVAAAATQVATAAQSLSQGATEQAATLEETSASMEEMSSMTRSNVEDARRAAALVTAVEHELALTNDRLTATVQTMEEIRLSSGRVGKIIKAIDEIAFQTNILALNAAVEAARAGEAGMGFAVVADEVRSLAQRAAEAARSTSELIEDSSRNAELGMRRVEEMAGAIGQFTTSVVEVRRLSEQVSTASDQQSQGIAQVTTSIGEMEKVTQSTAATAEESAAASEELNAQAETSLGIVRQLDTMVGGGARAGAARRARGGNAGSPRAMVVSLRSARGRYPAAAVEQTPVEQTGTYGPWPGAAR